MLLRPPRSAFCVIRDDTYVHVCCPCLVCVFEHGTTPMSLSLRHRDMPPCVLAASPPPPRSLASFISRMPEPLLPSSRPDYEQQIATWNFVVTAPPSRCILYRFCFALPHPLLMTMCGRERGSAGSLTALPIGGWTGVCDEGQTVLLLSCVTAMERHVTLTL